MDYAKYDWTTVALQFYYENSIKVLDWPQYLHNLNPIENLWGIMKRKIRGRNFVTINSIKMNCIKYGRIYRIIQSKHHEEASLIELKAD